MVGKKLMIGLDFCPGACRVPRKVPQGLVALRHAKTMRMLHSVNKILYHVP